MKGDLGSIVWLIIIVLGIAGKLLERKGPPKGMPPVARTRPGMPTGRPSQPADRPGRVGPSSGLGRPSPEVSRPLAGQPSALQARRLVNEPDDDEGVSLENVTPTVHVWQERTAYLEPEAAPQVILQPIPAQQAVIWAEILGKPVALRGRRK